MTSERLDNVDLSGVSGVWQAVACRGGANGATAPGIQDRRTSKEWNYKHLNAVTQGCATGGPRATTRPAKPFSVALANTLICPHHAWKS